MKKQIESLSVFLMGPTAVGKSEIALKIAEKFAGEIINADSMQVYRGLDIGTSKPAEEDIKKIPHHLINILSISEKLDVFKYKKLAQEAVCEIRKRGKIPIFVGGSGLYLRIVLDDLEAPPADPELSEKLQNEYAGDDGFKKLATFLLSKSPKDYQKTYPNRRRMIRAAEIFILNEKKHKITPKKQKDKKYCDFRNLSFVLLRRKEELQKRISERTDKMLESGWIEEAKKMILSGLLNSPTARQAIGYRIIAKHLAGEIDFQKMRENIISETLRLAKKQQRWFRNKHKDAETISLPEEEEIIYKKLLASLD